MKKNNLWQLMFILSIALLFSTCKKELPCNCNVGDPPVVKVRVFATGLNNPRGLEFGPDRNLYVAEGGIGGSDSTIGECTQVVPPVGPYTGNTTGGRISKVTFAGIRSTVTDSLPSSQTAPGAGSEVSGVADVTFVGNTLYALLSGAGCSHGVSSVPNGLVRINSNGSWNLVANISAFLQANPVENPEEDDFEPDGTPYSLAYVGGSFYFLEPNHGELDKISSNGTINRVVDISASEGHIVPTALTYHDGNFFVGNLNTFPIVEGSSNIYKITPGGQISIWASGFTTVLGIAFDNQNRLYVLESSVGTPFPSAGRGQIVRVSESGQKETIVTGLSMPTALTIGWDGKLYVSNFGYGPSAIGGGQVLEISVKDCDCDGGNKHLY